MVTITTPDKICYSILETSAALGLHPNTVRALIRAGRLPAIRLGRKLLVSRVELERWAVEAGHELSA